MAKVFFPFASAAEVIRADQKDLFYRGLISDLLFRVLKGFAGPRCSVYYQKELIALCDAIYYGLATLRGKQTPGEEFCDIELIDSQTLVPPTLRKRFLLVLLQVSVPYLYSNCISFLANLWANLRILGSENETLEAAAATSSKATNVLGQLWRQVASYHLAFFYLFGSYYHINKRVLRLRYLLLRQPRSGERPLDYSVLGVLMLIQLALEAMQKAREAQWKKTVSTLAPNSRTQRPCSQSAWSKENLISPVLVPKTNQLVKVTPTLKCMLCLDLCTTPTATQCGHVFCWFCIAEWCSTNNECPLCRHVVQSNYLVPVYQYG